MDKFNAPSKVVFKKNVGVDTAKFLKDFNKVFILTSKTPKENVIPMLSNFLNEEKIDFSVYTLSKKPFCDAENILKISSLAKNADIILSVGAGSVCDTAKMASKMLNIPYAVFPTTISHFGFFSNFAFVKNRFETTKEETNYPSKVFIDENIISQSKENFIISTLSFIFSFEEILISEFCKESLFSKENMFYLNNLKKLISRTEALANMIDIKREIALLSLQENIIELFSICNIICPDYTAIILANKLCENSNSTFGRNTLISSSVILECYKMFWNKQLEIKNIPNLEKYLKILEKNGKNLQFLIDFMNKTTKFKTNCFLNKIKTIKNKVTERLNLEENKFKKNCEKLNNLFTQNETKVIVENKIYDNLCYISISQENFMLNTLASFGYLNV